MHLLESTPALDRPATGPNNEAMYHQAAKRVIQWRKDHGEMNQVQFAKRAEISVGCLQSFEASTRTTRTAQLVKIAKAVDLTYDQLLAEDTDVTIPNPLHKDLRDQDLRLAQRFHHAGADTKHAVKAFLTDEMSEDRQERIARVLADVMRLEEPLLTVVETFLAPLVKDGRVPEATIPAVDVSAAANPGKNQNNG